MLNFKEVASSVLRNKLQEVQRVCVDGGKAVPTIVVEVIEYAREGIEMNRKNATLSDRNTDTEAKLVNA